MYKMYKRYKVFIRVFLLFLCLTFSANMASYAQTAETKDCPPQVYHLKTGHTVVIKEIHSNPIVTVDTWVKTGSVNEYPKINGVSHFLEHLMFKGSEKYKPGQFSEIIESKGGKFNAATSKDFTHFYITIPSKDIETAIKLHADMVTNSNLPEPGLSKERKVVIEEIRRSQDNPDSVLFDNLMSMIFKTHPYKYTTLGPQKNIEDIPRSDILAYYHKYYVPANMTTIVVGDVDPQKVLCLIEDSFKGEVSGKVVLPKFKREAAILAPETSVKKGKYSFGYMIMGFKGVPPQDKKDTYALDLAGSILGGGKSSRLYQDLKEKQNIVSSIGSEHYSMRDDSIFFVSADFDPTKYKRVKASVEKELQLLGETKVTDEELKRAKTQEERSFQYQNESIEEIANSIGYVMTVEGDIDGYVNHMKYVNAVTAEDIQKAVKKYIKPSGMALAVLLPENTKLNSVSSAVSSAVVPVSDTCVNTVKTVLNNGMTLITNKNTSNDIISLSVFVKGGKLLDSPAGITNLLVSTLMHGTKNRSALEIDKTLEDNGIIVSPSLESDYFEIQLKSTGATFDKAFDILADVIKNPAFSPEYIEKGKKDIIQDIIMTRDKPLSKASESFSRAMYSDSPYGNVGEVLEKSVPSITRDQLVDFHKRVFVPQNMVVSVSGNIDNDEIVQKFTEFAESFPSMSGEKFVYKTTPEIKVFPENKIVSRKDETAAAWMIIGWPAKGISCTKDFAALQVINSILGGGMSSRLHITFREKQGLSYAVGSTYSSRFDNSYFAMYIGTEPKNTELVRDKFLQETARLKTEKVSAAELEDAKQKIIGGYLIGQETNQDKAHTLGAFETIDKGYKFTYDFPDLINSVSSEDVINAANKYFSSPYVLSVVAPEKNINMLKQK